MIEQTEKIYLCCKSLKGSEIRKYKFENLMSEMLGTRSILNFGLFYIVEYLQIHNDIIVTRTQT